MKSFEGTVWFSDSGVLFSFYVSVFSLDEIRSCLLHLSIIFITDVFIYDYFFFTLMTAEMMKAMNLS